MTLGSTDCLPFPGVCHEALVPFLSNRTDSSLAAVDLRAGGTKKQESEQVKKEVDEAVDAIRGYSIERQKEAVDRARKSLAEADRRMDRLDAR